MPTADASQFTQFKRASAITARRVAGEPQSRTVNSLSQFTPAVTSLSVFLPGGGGAGAATSGRSYTRINTVTGVQAKPKVPGGNLFGTTAGGSTSGGAGPTWSFTYDVAGAGAMPTKPTTGPFSVLDLLLKNITNKGTITITFDTTSQPGFDFRTTSATYTPKLNGAVVTGASTFGNTLILFPWQLASPILPTDILELLVNFATSSFNLPLLSIVQSTTPSWNFVYNYSTATLPTYPGTSYAAPYGVVYMSFTSFPTRRPFTITFNTSTNSGYSLLTNGATVTLLNAINATASIASANSILISPSVISSRFDIRLTVPTNDFGFPVASVVVTPVKTWTWTPEYDYASPTTYPALPGDGPFGIIDATLTGFIAPRPITVVFSLAGTPPGYSLANDVQANYSLVTNIASVTIGTNTIVITPSGSITSTSRMQLTLTESATQYPNLLNFGITSITQASAPSWTWSNYDFRTPTAYPALPGTGPFGAVNISMIGFNRTFPITITFNTASYPSYILSADMTVNVSINGSSTNITGILGTNTITLNVTASSLSVTDIIRVNLSAPANQYPNLFNFPVLSITQSSQQLWTWSPSYDYTSPTVYPTLPSGGPFGGIRATLTGFSIGNPIFIKFDTSSNSGYNLVSDMIGGVVSANVNNLTFSAFVTLMADTAVVALSSFTVVPTDIINLLLTEPSSQYPGLFNFPILSITQDTQRPGWTWTPTYDFTTPTVYPALPSGGPFGDVFAEMQGFSSPFPITVIFDISSFPAYNLSTDMLGSAAYVDGVLSGSVTLGIDRFTYTPPSTIAADQLIQVALLESNAQYPYIFNFPIASITQSSTSRATWTWSIPYDNATGPPYPALPTGGPFGDVNIALTGFSGAQPITISFDTTSNSAYDLGADMTGTGAVLVNSTAAGTVTFGVDFATLTFSPGIGLIPTDSITVTLSESLTQSPLLFNFPVFSITQLGPNPWDWFPSYDFATPTVYPSLSAAPYSGISMNLTGFTSTANIRVTFDLTTNPTYDLSTDMSVLLSSINGSSTDITASAFADSVLIVFLNGVTISATDNILVVLTAPSGQYPYNFSFPVLSVTQGNAV